MESTLSPASLTAAFADLPDPRCLSRVSYPLPAILAMTVAAILANCLSVLAIAEWGADQSPALLAALGFPGGKTPGQSTRQRLFAKLDADAVASLRTATVAAVAQPGEAGLKGVAIDGKAQRGRLRFPGGGGPVHVLSAYCHDRGLVLAEEPICAPVSTDKGEAELTVAPALLRRLDWHGRVLTGDALFCQRNLCETVHDAGGDYLVTVKEHQRGLLQDLQFFFDPPSDEPTWLHTDLRTTRTLDYGHGRTLELRTLTASTDLNGYLDWPHVKQVLRIERTWREHGVTKRWIDYAITSLSPDRADVDTLLRLKRGHWAIENRLHWCKECKDVTLREAASLIHAGHGPRVMSLLRDSALNLLRLAGIDQIAATMRSHSRHPDRAVTLVTHPLTRA
jgi:predicted transposase YbfD/YdcC